MGVYESHVLPRLIDVALGAPFEDIRARVTSALEGDVLEVGFGSGRNVPHYPAAVRRVQAVDPAVAARALAAPRVAASHARVDYVGVDGARLPLDDGSVDHVLITWTLCSIPDAGGALSEVHRVLRPGGSLHFVEHGRSPDPRTARWQDRLTPLWSRIAGGCQLNRSIGELIAASGLELTHLDTYKAAGPGLFAFFYEGRAARR